jgi:signal transduction histidine kinase
VIREGVITGLANHTLLISRGGAEIPIDDSGAPIRNRAGRVIGAVLVFRDIRERKRAEDAQQLLIDASAALTTGLEVETTLATTAQMLVPRYADLCVIFLVAGDGMIHRAASAHVDDDAAAQLLALQRHMIPPDASHPAAQVMRTRETLLNPPISDESVEDREASAEERRRRLALAPPSQIIVPLVARGQMLGALSFGRIDPGRAYNVADLLLAQQLGSRIGLAIQNAQLYQSAQTAIGIRDQFLSIAAHELKTPLTALLGQVQLILRRAQRDGGLSERDQRSFTTVAGQAIRLNNMIAALFDIARLEGGRLPLKRAPLDLTAFVRQVGDELLPTLAQRQLIYEIPDTPLVVDGDAMRLEQVLQNLITNAAKYDPSGSPVRIRVERCGDLVCVAVSDQGIGIPAAALSEIFQRFYRAANADERHISGLGIGLYVVREIISLHGGTITVESAEGQGSTFTISLPLADQAA